MRPARIPGDHRFLVIPVPIPNTVVKQEPPMILHTRESRSSPGFSHEGLPSGEGLFRFEGVRCPFQPASIGRCAGRRAELPGRAGGCHRGSPASIASVDPGSTTDAPLIWAPHSNPARCRVGYARLAAGLRLTAPAHRIVPGISLWPRASRFGWTRIADGDYVGASLARASD